MEPLSNLRGNKDIQAGMRPIESALSVTVSQVRKGSSNKSSGSSRKDHRTPFCYLYPIMGVRRKLGVYDFWLFPFYLTLCPFPFWVLAFFQR